MACRCRSFLLGRLAKVQGKWLLTYNDHPRIRVRDRLEREAAELHVTTAFYIRSIFVAHLSVIRDENKGAMHSAMHRPDFGSVDRTVKRYIMAAVIPVHVAGSLPGKERRNNLEVLYWRREETPICNIDTVYHDPPCQDSPPS